MVPLLVVVRLPVLVTIVSLFSTKIKTALYAQLTGSALILCVVSAVYSDVWFLGDSEECLRG
jgi:hypothetical protein